MMRLFLLFFVMFLASLTSLLVKLVKTLLFLVLLAQSLISGTVIACSWVFLRVLTLSFKRAVMLRECLLQLLTYHSMIWSAVNMTALIRLADMFGVKRSTPSTLLIQLLAVSSLIVSKICFVLVVNLSSLRRRKMLIN